MEKRHLESAKSAVILFNYKIRDVSIETCDWRVINDTGEPHDTVTRVVSVTQLTKPRLATVGTKSIKEKHSPNK